MDSRNIPEEIKIPINYHRVLAIFFLAVFVLIFLGLIPYLTIHQDVSFYWIILSSIACIFPLKKLLGNGTGLTINNKGIQDQSNLWNLKNNTISWDDIEKFERTFELDFIPIKEIKVKIKNKDKYLNEGNIFSRMNRHLINSFRGSPIFIETYNLHGKTDDILHQLKDYQKSLK